VSRTRRSSTVGPVPIVRRAVAAVAAAVAVAGCSVSTDGHPGSGSSAVTIPFVDCTQALRQQGAPVPSGLALGCGTLAVPLDYSDPSRGTITLVVLRIHATADAQPVGSLLVNPGGPGASGLGAALAVATKMPRSVLAKYDVIGFDPRGVQESSPVHCLTDAQKDHEIAESVDVTTAAGFAAAKRDARRLSALCARHVGTTLGDYNTVNTARDMDRIRQGVGDDRMNYLGFSYGTELGWTYAHLFPDKVRAFVLDGAVDPDASDIAMLTAQVGGFELAFDQFAQACPKLPVCKGIGDPHAAVRQIAAAALKHPLDTGTPRRLTYSLAFGGVIAALYAKSQWPTLATALHDALRGNGAGLLHLADSYQERQANGHYTNLLDANVTISCNDSTYRPTNAQLHASVSRLVHRFPMFGKWQASSLFACLGWKAKATPVPPAAAKTPTTVLVLGNINDPATPYRGAQDLARDMGHARLLTWDGEGHTSYQQGSDCVDDYVNRYLLTLQVPPPGRTCPA
jgi:pimeloyl-ACP methyl ester carboxylesterase